MDNADTYTYTARNDHDPNKVITFTLVDHHLQISFADLAEKMARVVAAEEQGEELKGLIHSQAEPLKLKAMEKFSGPYHVADISATLEDAHLKIKGWNRMLGMRLTPYSVDMGRIDNPDAAEAFVDQLRERKQNAPDPGRFVGPLDYWFGWVALFIGLVVLFRWPRKS